MVLVDRFRNHSLRRIGGRERGVNVFPPRPEGRYLEEELPKVGTLDGYRYPATLKAGF